MNSKHQDQNGPGAARLKWWWKRCRASEGHQQRNHYANLPPLCLTSNNTALYICKAWQDTVHTALLSEPSHARMVTSNGWPLSTMRLLGQTSGFIQADTHKHWLKLSHTAHITSQGSNVAVHWDRPLFPRRLVTSQQLNNLISGARIIPAEVKSTWLALWIYSAGGLFGHL